MAAVDAKPKMTITVSHGSATLL